MGGFSSFAISFSLISITTGVFGNFAHGLRAFGPAVVFAWVVAAAGQLLVALIVADLAGRYPISGYGYQWTSRILNPHLGYVVGWCLMLQFLVGFPAVCATLSDYLCAHAGLAASWAPWVTVGIITLIAGTHLVGIRFVSLLNDAGVIAEIVGCIAITLILLGIWTWNPTTSVDILFNSTNSLTGLPGTFAAFGSSLLLGAWCITGFEAAADLAEETHQPRRTVPKAVLQSEISAGIGGLVMLVVFMLSITDLAKIQSADNPLLAIFESKLAPAVLPIVMLVVYVSIFACGVASMAAATRLLFAMARDNMLPGSAILSKVDPTTRSPQASIILVWGTSCVAVYLLQQVKTLSAASTVAAYLGYAGIVLAGILLRETDRNADPGGFQLGRWRWPVGMFALGWLGTAIIALTMTEENYLTLQTTAICLAIGFVTYLAIVRPRLLRGQAGPPPMTKDGLNEEESP